eukprot:1151141-Pelagomonas_calceolata.AAC.1
MDLRDLKDGTKGKECAHPHPFDPIGAVFALKCSWHCKLPEHMLKFLGGQIWSLVVKTRVYAAAY